MLRNVIIVTGTGALLFEKVWVRSAHMDGKGNMLASLLTTMLEFARQSAGMWVSYLEFGTGAITFVADEKTLLRCILFHDKEEGAEFAKLIANQILRSFVELYSDSDFSKTLNTSKFNSFANKVVEAISQSVRAILVQLKSLRGITNALVVYDDGRATSTGDTLDDQLGIVANLQAMMTFANDIMISKGDHPQIMTLDMLRQTVVVHRVGPALLVCVCKKNKDPLIYQENIASSVKLLDKVFLLLSYLQGDYGR